MAEIVIAGNTSGSVTIAAPDVAGTTTLTLPASSSTLATTADVAASTPASLSTASGAAPSYSARAWVNFNGSGTVAIRASGNVSSITDNGTGDYTVNFTNAMVDNNFSTLVSGNPAFQGASVTFVCLAVYNSGSYVPTTTSTRVVSVGSGGSSAPSDVVHINVAIFR